MEALRKYVDSELYRDAELLRLLQQAEEEHKQVEAWFIEQRDSDTKIIVDLMQKEDELTTLKAVVGEGLRLLERCDCEDGDCTAERAIAALREAVK